MEAKDILKDQIKKNFKESDNISNRLREHILKFFEENANDPAIGIVCNYVVRYGKSMVDFSVSGGDIHSDFSNVYDDILLSKKETISFVPNE